MNKETVIKEIQRLAAELNGVAPGSKRFESETGISESVWRGKYWETWSDAVKEAGFEPNQKKLPHSKEQLLEALAYLAKEKKRIPTHSQMMMQARSRPGSPWPIAFRRLGSASERIVELLKYCQSKSEYEDVIAICKTALAALPVEGEVNQDASDGDGVVYLIKSGRNYKIGCTKDTDRRMSALGYQTVEKNVHIHTIHTDDPYGIEKYWHARFADKRLRADGEWFALNAKDVAAFKRRKKFM